MISINGNFAQHVELVNWANSYNEKMLKFIGEPDAGMDVNEQRVIISMPEVVDRWFEMNCFMEFIKRYYFKRNGRESIYGGPY